MIGNGLSLALITGAAFYMIYTKLPRGVRRWMHKHVLFTDAICMLLTYALFGGTLVALFAAAWLGVIVSLMLFIMQNQDAKDMIESILVRIQELFTELWTWLKTKVPADNPDVVEAQA